jgi:hypothetical protein
MHLDKTKKGYIIQLVESGENLLTYGSLTKKTNDLEAEICATVPLKPIILKQSLILMQEILSLKPD